MSRIQRRFHSYSSARKFFILILLVIFSATIIVNLAAQNVANRKTPKPPAAPVKPAATTPAKAPRQQVDSSGPVTGIPWTGDRGVQESVSQIMQRAAVERAEADEGETE